MKRTIIGFCLALLVGYPFAALLNLPTSNVGLLKLRGFCRLCDLTNVNLEEMDLSGANLYHANLSEANLKYADLTGANLEGVTISETNLSCIGHEICTS